MKDPLALQAVQSGKMLAEVNGGDWRVYAHEMFVRLKIVENIMKEAQKKDPDNFSKLSFKEKAKISADALKIVMDREAVNKYANRLGIQ